MKRLLFAALAAAAVTFCVTAFWGDASAVVNTSTTSVTYSASGSTGTFAVPFPFINNTDLVVTDNGTTKTIGSHYTVQCASCTSGGTVTFVVNPTAGHTIGISRIVPLTQTFNARAQGAFRPASYEAAYDAIEMQVQQLQNNLNNALTGDAGVNFAFAAPLTIDGTASVSSAGSAATFMRSDAQPATLYTPTGTSAVAMTFSTAFARVHSVKDFGVTGAGDETAKFQNAVNAMTAGTTLYVPAGSYTFSGTGLAINKSLVFWMDGGATISTAGTSAIVVSASNVTIHGGAIVLLTDSTGADIQKGISPSGVVSDLTVDGVTVSGQATVQDGTHAWQYGFYNLSGQTLTNIRVVNSKFSALNAGISFNADTSGSITGGLVEGNYVTNIVGTASGSGYCIHLANGSGTADHTRIVHNFLDSCQRHSIYHAKGSGGVIEGNVIRQHRAGVFNGSQLPAIFVDRSQDVTVANNYLDQPGDGAICVNSEISTGAGNVCRNITITGNVIVNPKGSPPILIGDAAPSTNGYCENVTLAGNTVYNDTAVSGYSADLVRINQGKRITFVGNTFYWLNANNTNGVFGIRGTSEGAGTATYTDDLQFIGNTVYGTDAAGNHVFGFNWSAAAATSGIAVALTGNHFTIPNNVHVFGAGQTDANLIVNGQGQTSGLSLVLGSNGQITLGGGGTGTATIPAVGCIPVCQDTANASVGCAVAGVTLTATGTAAHVINYYCIR